MHQATAWQRGRAVSTILRAWHTGREEGAAGGPEDAEGVQAAGRTKTAAIRKIRPCSAMCPHLGWLSPDGGRRGCGARRAYGPWQGAGPCCPQPKLPYRAALLPPRPHRLCNRNVAAARGDKRHCSIRAISPCESCEPAAAAARRRRRQVLGALGAAAEFRAYEGLTHQVRPGPDRTGTERTGTDRNGPTGACTDLCA
jgi:hypothetical protein